jgi:hypothetical protein
VPRVGEDPGLDGRLLEAWGGAVEVVRRRLAALSLADLAGDGEG